MKNALRQLAAAMIIGMFAVEPSHAGWLAGGETRLPEPVAFSTQMELGDVAQATAWLDAGLSPDFLGSRIGSGLMIGAWEGNLELMRLFIARGADINLLNGKGESALALAAWRGQMEAARWLIERGARLNAPPRHWSPLHYAVFAGHEAMADYLIGQGADIDAQSTNGSSVLMMAVYEGREALARKLIEKGADRTPKNDWGDGALEWAMRNNNLTLARMVSDPESFNIAVSQPKEKWGEPRRSVAMSKALEGLLATRQVLVDRKMSTETIDRQIAAERVRAIRAVFDGPALQRASTLEISAERGNAKAQSVKIIRGKSPEQKAFAVPPATFHGRPQMPPKAPVKNY